MTPRRAGTLRTIPTPSEAASVRHPPIADVSQFWGVSPLCEISPLPTKWGGDGGGVAQQEKPARKIKCTVTVTLMALTSLAVMVFFNRDARSENAFATKIAPLVAGVIMLGLFGYIFFNYGGLTGTSGALGYILPGLVLLAAVVGYGLPVGLKSSNPTKFVRMGENKN